MNEDQHWTMMNDDWWSQESQWSQWSKELVAEMKFQSDLEVQKLSDMKRMKHVKPCKNMFNKM